MQRRADARSALVLLLAVLTLAAVPVLAQESAAGKPPTSASIAPGKQAQAPRLRIRLVTADQLNAPVGASENAARSAAAPAGSTTSLAIDIVPRQSDLEPQPVDVRAEPPPRRVDPAADLFDALVSTSWTGGGFDGPALTVKMPPASEPQQVLSEAPASEPAPRGAPRVPGSLSPAAAADDGSYRIGPGDVIEVFVWRNAELTREVPVRPDGRISLPLVGEVVAAGKSAEQLQQEITGTLGQYVQMPTVTVSIKQIRSLVVYVLGNVSKPGPVQMERNLTVLQAIAMAGGLNDFANRKDIVVLRTDEFGVHQRWSFRYDDVVDGSDLHTNLSLRAGDVIYVP